MKLRIRGNSVRLRLSPDDLETLLGRGAVEDRIEFPGGEALRYRLESAPGPETSAAFEMSTLIVRFPSDAVARWAKPDEVAMRAEQPLEGGAQLRLLVEKDFQCLVPRDDDEVLFPNPNAAADRS